MNFNLKTAIESLTKDSIESLKAAQSSLNNANDAYHLQMAISEHGETKVHQKAATLLMEQNSSLTYSQASTEVSTRISSALETAAGTKLFKNTRQKLNSEAAPEPALQATNT